MDNTFTVSDKPYFLSILTFDDFEDFCLWAQYREYERFQKLKGKLPDDVFTEEANRIARECSKNKIVLGSESGTEAMASPEGLEYLLYLALRKNHTEMTPQNARQLLTFNNSKEITTKMLVIAGLQTLAVDSTEVDNKKKETMT